MQSKVDYLIFAFLVLVSGLATKLFRGVEMVLIMFVISFSYLLVKKLVFDSRYILACAVWFLYIIFSFIKYPGDNMFWPFLYFCNLTLVFAIIRHYGIKVIIKYTDVMYFYACWSLVLYSWQLLSLDTMLPIWRAFDLSEGQFDKPYTHYAHAFFYTIHQFQDTSKGLVRNAGFCWEPGVFSCFLVLAIYLQLLRDSFKVDLNKVRYIAFLVALITTQSTTGALGFLMVFLGYVLNLPSKAKGKYLFAAALVMIPLAFVLPDQVEKIDSQLSDDLNEQIYMLDSNEHEKGVGRFQSVAILAIDFFDNPILGIGADRSASWVAKKGVDASPTSGIGNMFATYGLFLMLPFLYILFRSAALIVSKFECRGKFVLPAIFIILGFSFAVLETPVFLTISFLGYFLGKTKKCVVHY